MRKKKSSKKKRIAFFDHSFHIIFWLVHQNFSHFFSRLTCKFCLKIFVTIISLYSFFSEEDGDEIPSREHLERDLEMQSLAREPDIYEKLTDSLGSLFFSIVPLIF